ncbi:hypothetical protein EDC18_10150 [Natranaerovirga pectinivora]|uniref:Uncharacterized protein n=1 Tax=Natranaerovirga pectinivora TaxID=682400 RepID=A0A4R3MNC4_9FIRM|nr:hypothetical protein [Natranaerovirga pectinivora]TCT16755.1 hypothetical protein EDC18_10150 [Natranaerovirga pectinivora]
MRFEDSNSKLNRYPKTNSLENFADDLFFFYFPLAETNLNTENNNNEVHTDEGSLDNYES